MTPEEIALDQSTPGKFNFIERLKGRNLPREDVTIYLDEEAGYALGLLEELIADEKKDSPKLKELEAQRAAAKQAVADSGYVLTITGMTNERYDELVERAEESFPVEYETINNPLTGEKWKKRLDSDDRDALFNDLFLAESIAKVTDPDGDVDDDITPEFVVQFRNLAPLDGIRRVVAKAFKMRMASEWMDEIQNEDF